MEVTVKKPVNQLYNYSTVLGAAIKCKPYSEITVEIGTHLRTVKIYLQCTVGWNFIAPSYVVRSYDDAT